MTEQQQIQLLSFIVNFVALFHEEGYSRDCAESACHALSACLIGVVYELSTDEATTKQVQEFEAVVVHAALDKFYGKENAHVVC